jgi:hypothetical protein
VSQFFASVPDAHPDAPWRPYVYGTVDVRFADRKKKVDATRTVTRLATIGEGAVAIDWSASVAVDLPPSTLSTAPPAEAVYLPLPAVAAKPKAYARWAKELRIWIESNESIALLQSATGDVSRPDELERDFRARLQQSAREARDKALDTLRRKYAPKQAALEERLRRARGAHARESEQAAGQKLQTAISFGATVLGAMLGRRAASVGTVGRATTTMRGAGRAMKEARDVARAQENIEAIEADRQALETEFLTESKAVEAEDRTAGPLDTVTIRPAKGGIQVKVVALVWMPVANAGAR